MYLQNEVMVPGSVEILETPSYNFQINENVPFTFKYAYAAQSASHGDVFKVQASADCGGSWSDIYVPNITQFAAPSGGVSNVLFIPTTDDDWEKYILSDHPNFLGFTTLPNVKLRFYFKQGPIGFGNRLYLDEINFDAVIGINEFTKSMSLRVYPNPNNGAFNVGFTLSDPATFACSLTSVTGAVVIDHNRKELGVGSHNINISEGGKLSAGIYFLNMEFNGVKAVRKIVIN
jgi:hypothetical protein